MLGDLDAADFVGITNEDADRGAEAAEQYGVRFFDYTLSLHDALPI